MKCVNHPKINAVIWAANKTERVPLCDWCWGQIDND